MTQAGVPGYILGWLASLAFLLIILDKVGVVRAVLTLINERFSFSLRSQEDEREYRQKMAAQDATVEANVKLQAPYNSTWLMEQVSANQSAALDQLGAAYDFVMREISHKQDIGIEQGSSTKVDIQLLMRGQAEILKRLSDLFTEMDLVNRRIEEMGDRKER